MPIANPSCAPSRLADGPVLPLTRGSEVLDDPRILDDDEELKALERFKGGRFEGSAAATAIGGKKGAAAACKYKDGVAIMVLPLKGAMAEAAGGGQKFNFEPL